MTRSPWQTPLLALATTLVVAGPSWSQAPEYDYYSFEVPGAVVTYGFHINPQGAVAGRYTTETDQCTRTFHAFVWKDGEFTFFDIPGAVKTEAEGINARGEVTGKVFFEPAYRTPEGRCVGPPARAFVRTREGKFLDVTPPNAIHAVADQITPSGLVVGPLSDEACGWPIVGEGCIRGYLLRLPGSRFSIGGGTYEEFNYPGAAATDARSVNAVGDIVGVYDSQNHSHGFLLRDGQFSTIDYPGAMSTSVTDINPDGDMVGTAGNPIEGWSLSFLLTAGRFNEIRMPGAVWTGVWGINTAGTLSGHWTGTDGKVRGFIAKRR